MNPQVRYAKTSDGLKIAYATVGQGPPIVWMQDIPFSHMQFEFKHSLAWDDAQWREFLKTHSLVRFDPRGMGLSDRDVKTLGLDEWLIDLETVVDALGLERFVLGANTNGGTIAIAYTARHPERVSHLFLQNTGACPSDGFRTPRAQLMGQMLAHDFELFSENAGGIAFGWGDPRARIFAEFIRAAVTPQVARHSFAALAQVDVTSLLPLIQAPTMVLYNDGLKYITHEMSLGLASQIPNARLINLSGTIDNTSAGPEILQEFLEEAPPSAASTVAEPPSALRTVLFTDLVGHTEMMSRLGDERGRAVLREHEDITRNVLKQHGGTEVKTMGDGFMASFGSVTKAVECAIALQRAFAQREGEPLSVRVGLNAGEPIEEDGDLFGATVILASRIAAKANGGEILVADTVRGLCSGKGFLFADRGDFVAKGFEEPVRISQVNWRG